MTETNEPTQYRIRAADGSGDSEPWPPATATTYAAPMSPRGSAEPIGEDDQRAMQEYGIVAQPKVVYAYGSYVYDRLSDALAYARIDSKRR